MNHTIAATILLSALGMPAGLGFAQLPKSGPVDEESNAVLVDADWLSGKLKEERVRVLELGRKEKDYAESHIPGALFVHWIKDITDIEKTDSYNVLSPARFEALMSRLGVTPDSTIVLYDDLDNRVSARMFWTLRYYAHQDVRILNGGRQAWSRSGRKFTTLTPKIGKSAYRVGKVNAKYRVALEFVKTHLDQPDVALIDGRPVSQYSGKSPGTVYHTGKEHTRRGHIPGAINIFWKDNLNEDGTFKSAQELRRLYEKQGATGDKTIVTYCNEGLHAAPPWFVLTEILGFKNVRLYDDSMAEWANRDDVPITEGSKP